MKLHHNIIILLAISFIMGCAAKPTPETALPDTENKTAPNSLHLSPQQWQNANLTVGKLTQQNMEKTIQVSGKIDAPPQNLLSVSVPLGGYVQHTKLLPGMKVNKGEVIAVLEDPQYITLQQDYLTTKVKLAYAEQEYQRQQELNQEKAASDKAVQQALAEYQTLKITLSALAERLKLLNMQPQNLSETNITKQASLYAPFTGYVTKVNVNTGKYVSPSDVLFELVNPADIHLTLNVFEKDLQGLTIGQKLFAYTNTEPDVTYNAQIILIGKEIAPDNTVQVHCHFDQYAANLIPGMFMNAKITLQNKKVWATPEKAVVNYAGNAYLFTQTDSLQFDMQEVKTGVAHNGWIEILNPDLFAGKKVVTAGSYALLMALKNQPEEE
ncbi:MAG TPA: efflux RND transporter periplasmic adaptor subunit [Chitinophagales bacterium]|nr:efflux RND transporter periplasmic adaptor subunit [Chitinophagales bacterium]HRK27836.1 efflux RND transporter periplasmic adaptor subunit [Chitinophagales bacterium]